jgi:hypothetical protein
MTAVFASTFAAGSSFIFPRALRINPKSATRVELLFTPHHRTPENLV